MFLIFFANNFIWIGVVVVVVNGQLNWFIAAGIAVDVDQIGVAQVLIVPVGVIWWRFDHIRRMIQLSCLVIVLKILYKVNDDDDDQK